MPSAHRHVVGRANHGAREVSVRRKSPGQSKVTQSGSGEAQNASSAGWRNLGATAGWVTCWVGAPRLT